jgi:hypothetical protein
MSARLGLSMLTSIVALVSLTWLTTVSTVLLCQSPYGPWMSSGGGVIAFGVKPTREPAGLSLIHVSDERLLAWPPVEFNNDVEVAHWTLILLALVVGLIVCYCSRPLSLPNCCHECGYDLTGNVSGICPECGAACRRRDGDANNAPGETKPSAGDRRSART